MNIRIRDLGLLPDTGADSAEAFIKALRMAAQNEETVITLEKGVYDFYTENAVKRNYFISNTSSETEAPDKTKHIGILFENAKNITLDGNGSTLIFHGKFTQIVFDGSENITVKDLVTDFSRPTMTEMLMTEKNSDYCEFRVNAECCYDIRDGIAVWTGPSFEYITGPTQIVPADRLSTYRCAGLAYARAEDRGGSVIRFYGCDTPAEPGEILQVRDGIRDEVGFFAVHSRNIRLENVTARYMHGLGFVGQFSEDITLDGFSSVPNEEKGRTCSCFADSMHFSSCKGRITVRNGVFKGTHDDIMNVHGTFLSVTEITGENSVKVRFGHPQSYGFDAFYPGDEIAFVNDETLLPLAYGRIKSTERLSDRETVLFTEGPVPAAVRANTAVENLTWRPEVVFENNMISHDPTRGILISNGRKTEVRNNRFYRTGMSGVLIACDAGSWYESGAASDVLIENNLFEECGGPVISVAPEAKRTEDGRYVDRNICIRGNRFILSDPSVMSARNVDGLVFTGNEIISGDEPVLSTEHCLNVTADL